MLLFFLYKNCPISLTSLCSHTQVICNCIWGWGPVFEGLLPCTSLALMTVALSILSMEDLQSLWKLFKDCLNLFQIYQELIFSLFFFGLALLPSYPSSFLSIDKLKITPNLPDYSGALSIYIFTFQVNAVAWSNVFFYLWNHWGEYGLSDATEFFRSLKCVNEGVAYLMSPWIELTLKLCLHVKKTKTQTLHVLP